MISLLSRTPKPSEKSYNHQMRRNLKNHEESFKALQNLADSKDWDEFYALRGSDDSYEWCAAWSEIDDLLMRNLLWLWKPPESEEPRQLRLPDQVRILVPGCGNSNLSAELYDSGFRNVTNVDFSKVVITNMMRRNLRLRPEMKWRVMDMSELKFPNESFDVVVDKGGLDSLMQSVLNPRLGYLYLSEIKKVLADGGKFICFTLAESHVLDLLFSKFRFGWKTSLRAIVKKTPLRDQDEQIFALVAQKDSPASISDISFISENYSVETHGDEARGIFDALEEERRIREQYRTGCDVMYSVEDVVLGVKGNISLIEHGRRIKLILGGTGVSCFSYRAVLLDSKKTKGFEHHYGVLLVPKLRALDRVYSSEEGQWSVIAHTKAARLLMVFLDSSNSILSMNGIKLDLSRLVELLAPGLYDFSDPIPYFSTVGDGIRRRENVYKVVSDLSGPIYVEDVVYDAVYGDGTLDDRKYRHLIFRRTESLVQSEALLSTKEVLREDPKPKNKRKQRKSDSGSSMSPASSGEMEVVHSFLTSGYHNGIISGIVLISSYLSECTSDGGDPVKAVVLGLGGGLLPMFMKKHLPTLKIEVVETDPLVLDIARDYFGLQEDEHLKVRIDDAVKYVKEMADSDAGGRNKQGVEEESSSKVDILVVDVNSSDPSSGLTCPDAGFLDESFLNAAKESLSEQGLFVINMITGSSSSRLGVYSQLDMVFRHVLVYELEGDMNEVLFALKTDAPLKAEELSEARNIIKRSLKHDKECTKNLFHFAKSIQMLR